MWRKLWVLVFLACLVGCEAKEKPKPSESQPAAEPGAPAETPPGQ
jgi:hypothetical protein